MGDWKADKEVNVNDNGDAAGLRQHLYLWTAPEP
jgi:hypothetical protein